MITLPEPIDYCASLPSPCSGNGVCTNQNQNFLCTCDLMWGGKRCNEGLACQVTGPYHACIHMLYYNFSLGYEEFIPANITQDPELSDFPELLSDVSLTCGVKGAPEPNITWHKNGVLLPGERSSTLNITEVEPRDRGSYKCNATNFDPSSNKPHNAVSDFAIININGTIKISY